MSTELATTQSHSPTVANSSQKRDIRDYFQAPAVADQLKMALPKFLTPDRIIRIFLTQINGNPKLQECTLESLFSSLMRAAQFGLEPDGRHGHLIPRWNSKKNCMECSFQDDYKGLVSLVRKNPGVQDVYAELVHENDTFKLTKGLHRDLTHDVDIRADRGELIGAYAVILYATGYPGFEFMSKPELYAIRERSDGWRAYKAGKASSATWLTDEGEMCKKTVLRRLLKLADLDPDVASRVTMDVETETVRIEPAQIDQPRLDNAPAERQVNSLPDRTVAAAVAPTGGGANPSAEKPAATRSRSKLPTRPPNEPAPTPAEKPVNNSPVASTSPQAAMSERGSPQVAQAETPAEAVARLLTDGGYTTQELIAVAKAYDWIPRDSSPDMALEAVNPVKLDAFLGDWETVVDELNAARKDATAK